MSKPTVLIIGGTGAQGSAVAKVLAASKAFTVKILTRNLNSAQALELAQLPGLSLIEGDPYNESDLFRAFEGVDATFVNTNGFAIGEQAEIYWGIRIFEIALISRVKHFVYGGLEYISKLGGYDPKFRVGHYDGKGRVEEFIKAQPTSPMNWSLLNSGPYMDSLNELFRPQQDENGVRVFTAALGEEGAMPMIYLEDFGRYALWMFQHPNESQGMTLGVATEHISWPYLVRTFEEVTGKKARYHSVPVNAWVEEAFKTLPNGADTVVGAPNVAASDSASMTWRQNFTGWMNLYIASARNKGLIQRDYELLDRIQPKRVKSLGEWMRKTEYTGDFKPVLKSYTGV